MRKKFTAADNLHATTVRMPEEIWQFIRRQSFELDVPLNAYMVSLFQKAKEKHEKKIA